MLLLVPSRFPVLKLWTLMPAPFPDAFGFDSLGLVRACCYPMVLAQPDMLEHEGVAAMTYDLRAAGGGLCHSLGPQAVDFLPSSTPLGQAYFREWQKQTGL